MVNMPCRAKHVYSHTQGTSGDPVMHSEHADDVCNGQAGYDTPANYCST